MTRTPLIPTDSPQNSSPKSTNPLIVVTSLLLLLLVGVSALAFYFYQRSQTPATPSITPTPLPTLVPTVKPSPTVASTDSITWISPPRTYTALDIYKPTTSNNSEFSPSKAKYFQVATLPKSEKLIIAYVPTQGMGEYNSILRIVVSDSKNYLVSDSNSQAYMDNLLDAQKISLWPYQISELEPPENLYTKESKQGDYKKGYQINDSFESLPNAVLIQEFPSGSLYYTKSPVSGQPEGVSGLNYYFRLKDNTVYSYSLNVPSFNDEQKPNLTWADGVANANGFNSRLVLGCGKGSMSSNYALSADLVASKVHAGFMFNQIQPENEVFQIMDPNHALVKKLYDNYKVGRESDASLLSLNDFAAKHNHFIWKDKMGNYLLFINMDYQPLAECGKPVIYLYPTKPTNVSVKVGAQITQSEPVYPSTGWNVLANPNSQISYFGQTYPYLFWEGQGNGVYPDYRNQGSIVAQSELISVLTSQLHQLGLNTKETADFLEFWQPRLPYSPFVRLTWLGTADMDRLAPLSVTPRPDTSIRLFLEFEGLSAPVSLKPQKLTAPARRGFTLIEWGGLLIK